MNITFGKDKKMQVYEAFVNSPSDRKSIKDFCKCYPKEIMERVLKRHKSFKQATNAYEYNKIYGSTKNRIETLKGQSDKDNIILKVRITESYRKFFNAIVNNRYLKCSEWSNFDCVDSICVFNVTHHDYNL